MNSTFILCLFYYFFCSILVQNSSFLFLNFLVSDHFCLNFNQFSCFLSIFPLFELFVLIHVILISILWLYSLFFNLLISFILHFHKFLIIFFTKLIKFFFPILLNLSFFLWFLCLPLPEKIIVEKWSYWSIKPTFIHTWLHWF